MDGQTNGGGTVSDDSRQMVDVRMSCQVTVTASRPLRTPGLTFPRSRVLSAHRCQDTGSNLPPEHGTLCPPTSGHPV